MNNQIILIGRLVQNPREGDSRVTLAIPRNYKNIDGEYETDFIDVTIKGTIQTNVLEYCRKGDLIGIRGSIEGKNIDDGDGHYTRTMELVADRVTFLSARKEND